VLPPLANVFTLPVVAHHATPCRQAGSF
jgi:hypothetical protein